MTPITYAVQRIKYAIPKKILDIAFTPNVYQQFRKDPYMLETIDEQIIIKIINGRVRKDCDILGAEMVELKLMNIVPEPLTYDKYLLRIPKEMTGGRTITSVLALNFMPQSLYGFTGVGGLSNGLTNGCKNKYATVARDVHASIAPMAATETPHVQLVAENTVLVEDIIRPLSGNGSLRCMLSHDDQFSTLAYPALVKFGELCVLACKSYIYNELVLNIDQAQLVAGRALGSFKDIVDGYSDAEELYNTFLIEQWGKIQFMSDERRMNRFISMMTGLYK